MCTFHYKMKSTSNSLKRWLNIAPNENHYSIISTEYLNLCIDTCLFDFNSNTFDQSLHRLQTLLKWLHATGLQLHRWIGWIDIDTCNFLLFILFLVLLFVHVHMYGRMDIQMGGLMVPSLHWTVISWWMKMSTANEIISN